MSTVGQKEWLTQRRVVALFEHSLGYRYLGNRSDRMDNANIEPDLLRPWLRAQGHDAAGTARAMFLLNQDADNLIANAIDSHRLSNRKFILKQILHDSTTQHRHPCAAVQVLLR